MTIISTAETISSPTAGDKVAVIGAGIIGVCCAAELQERGRDVTLFDRGEPGHEGASRGNAGQVIPSLIHPVTYPGIWRDAPRLLFARDSPLAIRPAHLVKLVPWLCRFLWAGRRRINDASIAALAELNRGALSATRDLYRRAGLSSLLQKTGALHLHETEASVARARRAWAVKRGYGFEAEFLPPEALQTMEPDLSPAGLAGAVFEPGVCHVSDPLKIVEGVFRYACRRGTRFRRGEARLSARVSDAVEVVAESGRPERFDAVVIAAGAWSRELLRDLGDDAPLEAERGYNITCARPGVTVRHCLIFADRGFVATPLAPGLRIGGGVEFAGLRAPPDPRRLESILASARRFLPALDTTGGQTWMGPRPALPDSVPVIRRSTIDPRIVYAFGHGHIGLTTGPETGRRVAALLTGG